jgi:hypothetical protein
MKRSLVISAALIGSLAQAQAAKLTVVKVAAPAVNCVFNASCKVAVQDSVSNLTWSAFGDGAFLQSRTHPGNAGAPGAGTTAYEYRVDLRNGTSFTDCLVGMVIDFGPVKALTYPQNQPAPPNQPAHVFVVTHGGIGSVGIKLAVQEGSVITFTFDNYLCAGQSSFFFGLAGGTTPKSTPGTLFGIGSTGFIQADVRVPTH